MKKLVFAFAATLLLMPAAAVQAATTQEYVQNEILIKAGAEIPQIDISAQQDDEDVMEDLKAELLPVYKEIAKMLKNGTNGSKAQKFEELWVKAETIVSKYTDEITEEDLEDINTLLRDVMATQAELAGEELTREQLQEIGFKDVESLKAYSNSILLAMAIEVLAEENALDRASYILLLDALQTRMLALQAQ